MWFSQVKDRLEFLRELLLIIGNFLAGCRWMAFISIVFNNSAPYSKCANSFISKAVIASTLLAGVAISDLRTVEIASLRSQ